MNLRKYLGGAAILALWGIFCIEIAGEKRMIMVNGDSMSPTYNDGDRVAVCDYRGEHPGRFDEVACLLADPDTGEESIFIRRIIGLPGEVLQIVNGKIYIDGTLLEQNFWRGEAIEEAGIAAEPIQILENEYFLLGDNRNHSYDSRDLYVGNVAEEEIKGKVLFSTDYGDTANWFYSTEGRDDYSCPIEEEAEKIMGSYIPVKIPYIPLVETYKGENALTLRG